MSEGITVTVFIFNNKKEVFMLYDMCDIKKYHNDIYVSFSLSLAMLYNSIMNDKFMCLYVRNFPVNMYMILVCGML